MPVYLETLYRDIRRYADWPRVFTIHNLAYQGVFWHYDMPMTGLGWDLFTPAGLEFYGHMLNFLKGGLVFSDLLTTVSRTYAREIRTAGVRRAASRACWRSGARTCTASSTASTTRPWNPATDPALAKRVRSGRPRRQGRLPRGAPRARSGCPMPGAGPVVGMVTRLAEQKGLDLVAGRAARHPRRGRPARASSAPGEAPLEDGLRAPPPARIPSRSPCASGTTSDLARRIYAGADAFLMPSRYEPCGLGQLIALRYGTVPIVRRTGGLADTVRPRSTRPAHGHRIPLRRAAAEACVDGACAARARRHAAARALERLVRNAHGRADFSWDASARDVRHLYRQGRSRQGPVARSRMKKIEAIIKPFKLDDVKEALPRSAWSA